MTKFIVTGRRDFGGGVAYAPRRGLGGWPTDNFQEARRFGTTQLAMAYIVKHAIASARIIPVKGRYAR